MKTKFSVLGMLALLFGVILAGCDSGNDPTPPPPPPPPVEIGSLADLQAISADAANLGKSYKLTADIAGPVLAPIGSVSGNMAPFTGDFDGNGHSITVNITSGAAFSQGEYTGIFAGLFAGIGDGGSVRNLKVNGTVNILNSDDLVVGAGGVAGGMLPGASISNVESSVGVTVTSDGNRDVIAGGIVGGVQGGTLSNSHATGTIVATSTATSGDINVDAGGIVGAAQGGVINRVYATGCVTATGNSSDDGNVQAGGIAGAADEGTSVRNAYATGTVTATGNIDVRAGGIAGNFHKSSATMEYVYATGDISVTAVTEGAQAGGVLGNFYKCSGKVSHAVALNAAIVISGSASSQNAHRVIGRRVETGTMANNYGNEDLTPTLSQGTYTADEGADKVDGEDVEVMAGPPYTAPNETWWRTTGFSGADWTTVWDWDDTSGLPKLR